MTRVLVTGAAGQDAYYLMPKLAHLGYEVVGMVRPPSDPQRYNHLRDVPFLTLVQADLLDYSSLLAVASEVVPDIVINTAGLTSPSTCWGMPELTLQTNGMGAVRLPDIICNPDVKFIQFGSIAEFGPYGASKLYAERMFDDLRVRGIHTTTIRFAGHHSPRRSSLFFSRRVSQGVARIAGGAATSLPLGPLQRMQDWGYAPEFMDAVIEILDKDPGTYSVGTGQPESLETFVRYAFEAVGLDHRRYIEADAYMAQPYDVSVLSADPDPRLSWRPATTVKELARIMVEADIASPS